jgi:hypothetical protein
MPPNTQKGGAHLAQGLKLLLLLVIVLVCRLYNCARCGAQEELSGRAHGLRRQRSRKTVGFEGDCSDVRVRKRKGRRLAAHTDSRVGFLRAHGIVVVLRDWFDKQLLTRTGPGQHTKHD